MKHSRTEPCLTTSRHLLLSVPSDWSTDDKGTFFEDFVVDLLRPMRYRAEQRLRVTGMEIDLLARAEDEPRTILVECKAYRDPIPSDVITKLLGNVQLRKADQGWLFTTSDLTKDGRGLWEDIQGDHDHARRLVWYSPSKILDVLIAQRSVVDPTSLSSGLLREDVGDWSLVVAPGSRTWLVELLADGIPARFAAFDARTGSPLDDARARQAADAAPRLAGLQHFNVAQTRGAARTTMSRASVARVLPGDTWDDPRPARPADFVGRDETIESILGFLDDVRAERTSTRSFALLAPSGWGKSSLALRLTKARRGRTSAWCSITAVDSRSATSPAFVAEALRMALVDAVGATTGKRTGIRIQSLRDPLESPDAQRAIALLEREGRIAVVLFDQFEELFAKESLFEVFNAVRDLSLDVDAQQLPLVLGFAWKTDVSLPQEHPAYHLWHQLADRRRMFRVGEFGRGEIARVISKAENALGKQLTPALRTRLAEQCQGLPWLLKKLLVHVLQRVSTQESQYLLLERELDVELLFKDDLEQLKEDHIRCLKYVAARAPIAVTDVEERFSREATNLLLNQRLLVRSGMNYVVYWDIFRDYLNEGKVPVIPWARTFQRSPPVALRALSVLSSGGPMSASVLGLKMSLKEGPTLNLLGDLVSLQLVESAGIGLYRVARHVTSLDPFTIAAVTRNQLRRHVVAQAIERSWQRGDVIAYEAWLAFFAAQQPRTDEYADATVRQYAGNLKSWLAFAGLLQLRARGVERADGDGAQMGIPAVAKSLGGVFLGTTAPARLEQLLKRVYAQSGAVTRSMLESEGLRNAAADGVALGLISSDHGILSVTGVFEGPEALVRHAKATVLTQESLELAVEWMSRSPEDRQNAAQMFARELGAEWKPQSAARYFSGLLRYAEWARRPPPS